jgi:predicted nucleotidyltransferase
MDNALIEKIKALKTTLKNDNFILMGILGSFARGEEHPNSDVDILYKIDDIESYLKKYSGWDSINHIVQTKQNIRKEP